MGDMVISLVLEKFGCLPQDIGVSPAPVLVTVFDENSMQVSMKMAATLRQAGIKVACYPEPIKIGKQFKYADRMGMKIAIIIGPDEQAKNLAAVKDLRTGDQETIAFEETAKTVQQMLARSQAS